MCGIAGIIDYQMADHSGLLQDMAQMIQHRGPDDAGFVQRSAGSFSFGLASRRLSIIDLTAAGHMPMTNAQETIWITYRLPAAFRFGFAVSQC